MAKIDSCAIEYEERFDLLGRIQCLWIRGSQMDVLGDLSGGELAR